jgi:C-terminal processing protease CtpA/Prc
MRKFFLFTAILFTTHCSFAQGNSVFEKFTSKEKRFKALSDSAEFSSGSKVSIGALTPSKIENLSLLGKVWGFLKYYHPSIARGNYNWDFELFRFLPSYLNVISDKERDILLVNWVKSLGTVQVCKTCTDEFKNVVLKPDLDWIDTTSDSLKSVLNFIRQNRHQGEQYYVKLDAFNTPVFLHENPYRQFVLPDEGYRLLCLFRYWNIIQYWFPDRQLIGEDWKIVLTEFISKLINLKTSMEYWTITEQLNARIHDSHAQMNLDKTEWIDRYGRFYPPAMITFVGDEPVVSVIIKDTLSALSNIKKGDVIKTVSGKKVADIIKERLPVLSASNYSTQLKLLTHDLLASKDSIMPIQIERDGKILDIELRHFSSSFNSYPWQTEFAYQKDSSFFFIQPGIGYINIEQIRKKEVRKVFKALKGSKGVIIDDRRYPVDFPLKSIVAELNPKPTPYVMYKRPNLEYPGTFTIEKPRSAGRKNKKYYRGKVIILVNENTVSRSELHAMALRTAPNSKVIGSTTQGADGNTTYFFLPGGISTGFSGLGVWYPDGTETQRVGIIPDIEAKRTIKGITEGRDELVEKAIELINQE